MDKFKRAFPISTTRIGDKLFVIKILGQSTTKYIYQIALYYIRVLAIIQIYNRIILGC